MSSNCCTGVVQAHRKARMLRVSDWPVDHCTHIQRHVLSPSVPIGKAVALENLHPVGADPEHCLRSMLRSIEHVRRFTLVHQAEKASVESFAPTMVQIGENLVYIGNKHHHAEDGRVCHDSYRDAPQHVCHRIVKAAVPGCKSCVVVSMLDSRQSAIVDRLGIVLLLSHCHKHVLHTLCLGMVHGLFPCTLVHMYRFHLERLFHLSFVGGGPQRRVGLYLTAVQALSHVY